MSDVPDPVVETFQRLAAEAVEREVLALVATSDAWLPATTIQKRLGLTYNELAPVLRDLVRAGDLDWSGVVPGEIDFAPGLSCVAYHLPFRNVSFRRRLEGVAC